VFLTTAEPSYEESISLMIDVDPYEMSGDCTLIFSFNGLSRPPSLYDFRSEPSFLGLHVIAVYFPGGGSTLVYIDLNESKIDKTRGRFIADKIIYEFEESFGIFTLLYDESAFIMYERGHLFFPYFMEFPAVDLRNIFLGSLPYQGFRQILTSMLLNSQNYSINVYLGREGGWSFQVTFNGGTKEMVLDQEQIISLKEITGYSGSLISSPTSSSSIFRVSVSWYTLGDYDLLINEVSPSQMQKSQNIYGQRKEYVFSYDVTGSSIQDFSISLKIVKESILAIVIILLQITTVLISIIIIKRHKKSVDPIKRFF